jgi:hypothetical protein
MRVLLVLAILTLPARSAWAKADRDFRFGVAYPHGEGGSGTIYIHPAADDTSVTIEWSSGGDVVRRTFDAEMLRELRKRWGAARFDISSWKSDLGCDGYMEWTAEAGGDVRHVCRDEKKIARLADLMSMLQLIMR